MTFTHSPYLQSLERIMQTVSNFRPPGHGLFVQRSIDYPVELCDCDRNCISAGNASYQKAIMETMAYIRHKPFHRRLNRFLAESEDDPMMFQNDKHRAAFAGVTGRKNKKDLALISALYLLTADAWLWQKVKRHVSKTAIDFGSIQLQGASRNNYAVFCCAKDLYLGTKHITISDLADTELIAPKTFGLMPGGYACGIGYRKGFQTQKITNEQITKRAFGFHENPEALCLCRA